MKKSRFIKTVSECVKESNKFIGLKMTCLGVLERGECDNDNETGLKEGGVIEMSYKCHRNVNYSAPFAPSLLRLKYLPSVTVTLRVSMPCQCGNGV